MIVDVHVHICPPKARADRTPFLEGEPEFAAIYKDPKAVLTGASELINSMDEQGVDKCLVFGFPWRKPENYKLNNDYVLESSRKYGQRLIPFCCLSPAAAEATREVERCLQAGAHGVGELAFYSSGLDEKIRQYLQDIAYICRGADAPILLHTNEPVGHSYPGKSPMTLAQLYALLEKFPDNKWILAHLGGGLPFFGFLKKKVRKLLQNCWFDTAAMPFLYRPEALQCMAWAVGTEKILFGTDYPLLPPSRYFKEFAQSGLSEEQRKKILGENAARLLKL